MHCRRVPLVRLCVHLTADATQGGDRCDRILFVYTRTVTSGRVGLLYYVLTIGRPECPRHFARSFLGMTGLGTRVFLNFERVNFIIVNRVSVNVKNKC